MAENCENHAAVTADYLRLRKAWAKYAEDLVEKAANKPGRVTAIVMIWIGWRGRESCHGGWQRGEGKKGDYDV